MSIRIKRKKSLIFKRFWSFYSWWIIIIINTKQKTIFRTDNNLFTYRPDLNQIYLI
jgi:hypothetical protein